jgi:hypothetical protein
MRDKATSKESTRAGRPQVRNGGSYLGLLECQELVRGCLNCWQLPTATFSQTQLRDPRIGRQLDVRNTQWDADDWDA